MALVAFHCKGDVMTIKSEVKDNTFKNVSELDKSIDQVILGASNLKKLIQIVSVGIVSHAAGKGNGNVTRAKKLVDGLGAGIKQDSLIEWFAQVGINFDEEGNVSLDRSMLTPENFSVIKAKHWYKYKKSNPYKGFDLKAKVHAMLKQAYQAEAKTGAEAELVKIDPAMLKQLEAMLPISERPKKVSKDVPLTAVGKDTKQKKVA